MKKFLFLIALMAACLPSLAQVQITEAQALQAVKNLYPSNTVYDYYIAKTDTIYDDGDGSCVLDEIPQASWLTSNSPKWLIFVDEKPMTGWSHPCSYFYVPQECSSVNSIPIYGFEGVKYPRKIELTLIESQREAFRSIPTYSYQHYQKELSDEPDRTIGCDYLDETIVIMIGGGYERANNYLTYWNDCEYFYNVLKNKCNIDSILFVTFFPTSQLRSNQGYELYVNRPQYFNGGNPPYQLMFPNRKDYINEILDIYYLNEDDGFAPYKNSNLIIYISCHGDIDQNTNEPYICLWDMSNYLEHPTPRDNRLYASELDSIITAFGARNTTIILQNCFSGAFIEPLQGTGRTIITAASEDGYSWSLDPQTGLEYNEFSYHLINALNQEDVYGTPVASDTNQNGHISMKEAFLYAQSNDEGDETPMYNSMPEWLGDEFSFDVLLDSTNLFVHDNLQDVGSRINSSSGNFWNSPDIWLRNQNDGFTVKENDHLLVGNDEELYIYVQVNNRGYRDYVDPSKYLHLYWKTNTLKMGRDYIYGTNTPYGGKIAALSLDTAIVTDTSCIYRYVWQPPATLVSRAANNGNILDIEVLALVNDTIVSVIPEDAGGMIALRENSNVAIRKENTIKPSLGTLINIPPSTYMRRVKIPVYISPSESNTASKITLEVDTSSTGNVFQYCRFYLELSLGIYASSSNLPKYNITTTNSAPRKYKLNGNGSYFNLIVPQGGIDSLVFYCENDILPMNAMNGILHLKLTNASDSLLDAETFRIFLAGNNGGGPGGPGIITMTGDDDRTQLVATGIEEPSLLEWYSPQQELIGEEETLQLAASRQQGVYTLRVASKLTGAVSYATATIADDPAIESVTPNPFSNQFTVRLSHPAMAGSEIRLTAVNGTSRVIEAPVAVGDREIVITANDCPSGIYVVNLVANGAVVGESRVIKQ
ncbi:MAG: T9SS type A sorting domain-containing protein [Muribaculaceae bacterium]|nr:T9SS type A sorting domain-containing protein [Muribaculaceae bacterium]